MSKRRIIFVLIFVLLLFGIIELKLFSLQIISGGYYRIQAHKRTTRIELIPARRGKIKDRNGQTLVQDTISFDLYLIPREITDRTTLIRDLALILNVKPAQVEAKLSAIDAKIERLTKDQKPFQVKKIIREQKRQTHKIFSNIPFERAAEIESAQERFSGVVIKERMRRHYLYDKLAAHIVGYMKQMDQAEYDRALRNDYFKKGLVPAVDDATYQILLKRGEFFDDQIGAAGVEKIYNDRLVGRHGVKLIERDFTKKQQKELSRVAPQAGTDLILTIDFALQKKMDELLKGKTGSAIVMDVRNGEILAMSSAPSFNPNKLQRPVSQKTIDLYFNSRTKLMVNRPIAGSYALGSIFKMITAMAALEEKKIKPGTSFYCDGYFSRKLQYFKCWVAAYHREHGPMTLREGIQHSCNVFFYNSGKVAGGEALTKWARIFGFGQTTGVELPGSISGLVPDKDYHRRVHDKKWYLADTLNLSIGQGDLMVSPIQVTRMMAAIANDGYLVRPHLLRDHKPESGTNIQKQKINVDPKNLLVMRQALRLVVQEPGGTAYKTGLNEFPVAGKTSTAQAGPGRPTHAWFAGFAPYHQPRIAFVVMIERGGKGSVAAAPIAAKFMKQALKIK